MARKKKELKKPLSSISFRLRQNINPKTLALINKYYLKGQLSDLINNALELYRMIYIDGEEIASLLEGKKNSGQNIEKEKEIISENLRTSFNFLKNIKKKFWCIHVKC